MTAYFFGELAALFIAHITRRRTDESADGKLFSVFAHVDSDERILTAEEMFGKGLHKVSLTDTGRSDKHEGSDGTVGVLQSQTVAGNGAAQAGDGTVLRDNLVRQCLLQSAEPCAFVLLDALCRNAAHG